MGQDGRWMTRDEAATCARLVTLMTGEFTTLDMDDKGDWHVIVHNGDHITVRLHTLTHVARYGRGHAID